MFVIPLKALSTAFAAAIQVRLECRSPRRKIPTETYAMNSIDLYFLELFNSIAHRSYVFDRTVGMVADNIVVKGALLTSLLWLAWFNKFENEKTKREFIIATIFATLTSTILIKLIRFCLTFRQRPMHDKLIEFVWPYGVTSDTLWNLSSFPSDTAGFAMALAVGQIFIWGRRGWLAVLFTLVFICIPRIYLGYHYPSDIAAGALIGGLVTVAMCQDKIRIPLSRRILSWSESYPGAFYCAFFLLTYEIAKMFGDVRFTLTQVWSITHHP